MENALLEKLTITVPVYNDAQYIRRTVESYLGQAGQILIYDNASTDGTGEICAALAAQHASVRHIRHDENIGAFENFRKSLFDCETEYFCWIGSHDLIAPGYSLKIIHHMEKAPHTALGAGTIVHIDETGAETGFRAKARWARYNDATTPLDRVGICLTKLRKDCSIFYGIYRTVSIRKAWIDSPCLGFDRVILGRVSAVGRVTYIEEALFFARNLDKSRDNKKDRERRAKEVGKLTERPLAKDVFTRNKMMVQTVLDQAHSPEDLGYALDYIQIINQKYQNRRRRQRRRILWGIAAVFIVAAFALALHF